MMIDSPEQQNATTNITPRTGDGVTPRGFPGDSLVAVSNWNATYVQDSLSVTATVAPNEAENAITYVSIALVNPRNKQMLYCINSTSVNVMQSSPGTRLTTFASTQLFSPEVYGREVLSLLVGFVQTRQGSQFFSLECYFDLALAK